MDAAKEKKQTKGRQRIEIKKLEKKSSLEVTFSKRKKGLFNKASELSALCGAEVAIIIFSPHGKVFSFGHPSVDAVVYQYLTGKACSGSNSSYELDLVRQQYKETLDCLEEEKNYAGKIKRGEEMNENAVPWWDQPVDSMTLEELEKFVESMEQLRMQVEARVDALAETETEASSLNQFTDHNVYQNRFEVPFDSGLDEGIIDNMINMINMEGFYYL